MSDAFERIDAPTAAAEAGYVNNPADPGGETIWGITKAVARENGYAGQMVQMTRDQARRIRRATYYAKPGIDRIAPLSEPIAAEVYDTGINMGTGTAVALFQRLLNVFNRRGKDYPDIAVDGSIGQGTATALQAFLKARGAMGQTVMLRALNALQGARYVDIAEAREASEDFIFGWFANRVDMPR